MGIGVVSHGICCVCGTEHHGPASCPGELRATGAEKPGWRTKVASPVGHEDIGVLLAPSHDLWRARIVTYPNTLWTAPGGRGTLKFVGETREQAEAQAIAFVERHVEARRARVRGETSSPQSSAAPSARHLVATVTRKLRVLPVRFGVERALTRGITVNLSVDGMFIGVADPEDGGRSLLLHLDLDGHTIPMRGLVMWNRPRAAAQRPAGMGIRLSNPPPLYQSYVAALP